MGVKYTWWGYAKNMVRCYPQRVAQYEDIIAMSVTPSLTGLPRGNSPRDAVGDIVARAQDEPQYKEYWAVKRALEICDGIAPEFNDFVRLYYWTTPRLQLWDIADRLHYSPETIRKWNKRLLYNVARERGLYE